MDSMLRRDLFSIVARSLLLRTGESLYVRRRGLFLFIGGGVNG